MAALAADLGVGQTLRRRVDERVVGDNDRGGDDLLRCSFCGKDQYQLRKLVAGPNAHICADCVDVCVDIMSDDTGASETGSGSQGRVVGSITVARCSLCRTPTPIADLATVETRGALCESCLTAVAATLRERDPRSPE